MIPLRAWANDTDIAISGYQTKNGKRVNCYIVLPISVVERLKNDQNQVALSQLNLDSRVRSNELEVSTTVSETYGMLRTSQLGEPL